MGSIRPFGNDMDSAWDSSINGRTGIGRITQFEASPLNSQIAGEVKNFDVTQYMSIKESRQMDTFIHYGVAAGVQAWRDSGLELTQTDAERVGVIVGSGIGGLPRIDATQIETL